MFSPRFLGKAQRPFLSLAERSHSTGASGKRYSPAALALIRANPSTNFDQVTATGPRGHILKTDILNYLSNPQPKATTITSNAVTKSTPSKPINLSNTSSHQSKYDIPHFYSFVDCSIDRAKDIVKRLKVITLDDLILAAASRALFEVPEVNVVWANGKTLQFHDTITDVSLLTPTADGFLSTISFESPHRSRLSSLALRRAELEKQASVSNSPFKQGNLGVIVVGRYPTLTEAPLFPIPPTRTLSLGVSGINKRVVPSSSPKSPQKFKTESYVSLSLACDHRVIDGVSGARYLQKFKQILEDPDYLIL